MGSIHTKLKKQENSSLLSGICMHICQFYLYLIAANLLIVSVFFLFGGSVCFLSSILSILAAAGLLLYFYGNYDKKYVWIELLASLLILFLLIWASQQIYDLSYDGNAYHKVAAGLLAGKWNPLYKLPRDYYFNVINTMSEYSNHAQLWIETYGKVTWIFAAGIYQLTGNIEGGKAYTLLGMLIAFLMTVGYLKKLGKGNIFCILFALAAMMNPIALAQFDCFYIDGFLHSILYVLLIALLMQQNEQVFNLNVSSSLVFSAMVICGNIKATGMLYGGTACVVYFLWYCYKIYRDNERKAWLKQCSRRLTFFIFTAFSAAVWAGGTTYMTNLFRHGSITYPLTGKGAVDIMSGNSPFLETNHFKNLFHSLFSQVNNYYSICTQPTEFKLPFTFDYWRDKAFFLEPDLRLSGFGSLFSGILILSLVIIAVKLLRMKKGENSKLLLVNILLCVGMTLIIRESWWARYAAYLYILVLIGLYLALDSKKKWMSAIGVFLSLLMIFNASLFLSVLPRTVSRTKEINFSFEALKSNGPCQIHTCCFDGVYFNFMDHDISYVVNPELKDDSEAEHFIYQGISIK